MPFMPSRLQEDILEVGGALATGAGLEYFAMPRADIEKERNLPLIVDLAVGAVGILGSSQLSGSMASLAEGVSIGAIAHAGSYMYRLFKKTSSPSTSEVQTLYSVPSYSYGSSYTGYASSPSSVIEI